MSTLCYCPFNRILFGGYDPQSLCNFSSSFFLVFYHSAFFVLIVKNSRSIDIEPQFYLFYFVEGKECQLNKYLKG